MENNQLPMIDGRDINALTPSQILYNRVTYVMSNELIENFLPATNPFVAFYGMQQTTSYSIQFSVLKSTAKVVEGDLGSTPAEAPFGDTQIVRRNLTKSYVTSVQFANTVFVNNDPVARIVEGTIADIANALNEQLYKDNVVLHQTYTKKVDVAGTPDTLKAADIVAGMIKAYQTAYSTYRTLTSANIESGCYFITDTTYNLLTGLVGNATGNPQAYNIAAQNIVGNGTDLRIKGVKCVLLRDDAFMDATGKMTTAFYFTQNNFVKIYALKQATITSGPVTDTRGGQRTLFSGEFVAEGFPYLSSTETDSRWGYRGDFAATPSVRASKKLASETGSFEENAQNLNTNQPPKVTAKVEQPIIKPFAQQLPKAVK